MVFEISSERIRRLQAGLRREAGLLSYEPTAPSPPQLPTIRDAVAALDPGLSSSLRCERCGGGLLKGLQSTICIYCGKDRRKEDISHSISFNSTVGCQKLLDFLGLDGSEAVLLDTDTSGSKKGGQDTPKSELVLSDLLDLVLKWPSVKEDVEENDKTTSPSLNTNVLRLTGVDLDDIFPERKGRASSIVPDPDDEFMPRQNSEENIHVSSETNFTALGKPQNTETKTSFFSSNIDGSFSAWNAEFQAASTSTSAVSPKYLDLFQDSSVSSLSHVITEDTKDQLEKIETFVGFENKSGQPISVIKVFQDDFCPTESDKIESSKNSVKDEIHIDKGNSVTKDVSEFSVQDGLQLSSNNTKSEISTHNNLTDDSFDDWQDFTSSARRTFLSLEQGTGINLFGDTSATKPDYLFPKSSENELQSQIVGKNDPVDDWQDFASFGLQESSIVHRTQSDMTLPAHSSGKMSVTPPHTSSNSRSDSLITMDVSHDDSSDVWCFASSVEDPINQEAQTRILPLKDSLEIDAVNLWPTSNTKDLDKRKPLHGDDDSDDWQYFASFAEGIAKSLNVESQSNSTFLDLTLETKSTDTWPLKEKETTKGLDDAFDDWRDFTSFVEVRGGLSGDGEQSMIPVFVHPSETNSFHQQGMKTDVLFNALEIQKHQSDENNSKLDVLTFDRTNEVDKKTALDPHSLWNANENIGSFDANSDSEPPKSNAEKLVSQMHDLSFMLVDDLSVPENRP